MAKRRRRKNKRIARNKKKSRPPVLPRGVWPKIFAIFCWLLSLIFGLGFLGKAGLGGDLLLRGVIFLVGKTVYALPLILVITGFFVFKTRYRHYFLPSVLGLLFLVLGGAGILALQGAEQRLGGIVGFLLSWPLVKFFGFLVSQIIFLAVILIGAIIFWHLFWQEAKRGARETKEPLTPVAQPREEVSETKEKPQLITKPRKALLAKIKIKRGKPSPGTVPILEKKEEAPVRAGEFLAYPLNLLEAERGKPDSGDINKNSGIIKSTLENFEILVEMAGVHTGPTVAQYTLKPAEGVKLSKITALNSNLALALAAHPIRIEAPIPGKALVGIEVPNRERMEVRLRNLLERPEFQKNDFPLMITLGRDVAGHPVFTDMAKMPHLLVAGATGTGKTLFLNSLILSLLQKSSPETLRFILIDPKRVEFSIYREMPHLLGPVIFGADKTCLSLKWLISEMERRFRALSAAGARDIASYNKVVAGRLKSKGESQKSEEQRSSGLQRQPYGESPSATAELQNSIMPYIILIIDELADLMAAKGREIEADVVRLAQMARAVGIHLVVATQRPSVEVLTGLIKANITSRITFQVATQVDSRTVLDMAGAEKLLGSGDMLFLSAQTPKPKRIQSAFVSEKEVRKVMNWLRARQEYLIYNALNASLAQALRQEMPEGEAGAGEFPSSDKSDDVLYEEAKKVVIEARKASASLLQRRLRIGYARAARLLDILEARGVVGPADGAKPRQVYGEKTIREEEFDQFENLR